MNVIHDLWLWQAALSFANAIIIFCLLPALAIVFGMVAADTFRNRKRINRYKKERNNVHRQ